MTFDVRELETPKQVQFQRAEAVCMDRKCTAKPEFRCTRSDAKLTQVLLACGTHCDLMQGSVLGVKYGNWTRVIFERITS